MIEEYANTPKLQSHITPQVYGKVLEVSRIAALLAWVLILVGFVNAQTAAPDKPNEAEVVITGMNEGTVFGVGNSVRVIGTVKHGAM